MERLLVPGWNVASSERALACVERFAWLDAAVGVHPHDAAKVDDLGWTDLPFNIPNHQAENGPAQHHVRIGWMRSVGNSYHAFAIHSFVDELAAAAGRDRVGAADAPGAQARRSRRRAEAAPASCAAP